MDTTQIVVAAVGASGLIGAAYVANRKASQAIRKSKEASDLSFPLQVLKETIAELRTESTRLQKIIEGLNKTIDLDQIKYAAIVKERDELQRERERLEEKLLKCERKRRRLEKESK